MSGAARIPSLSASRLARALPARSPQSWVVGGWVRDRLLGRPTSDADIAIGGDARAAAQACARRLHGSLVVLDERRGNYRVVAAGFQADFTALRAPTIEEDLSRRDFTINAVALPVRHLLSPRWRQQILDPHGGLKDLDAMLVRLVYPAAFESDPLRMLRAVRFAACLGFGIERATRHAISRHCGLLSRVAGERVRDELLAILRASRVDRHLSIAHKLGLLRAFIPEVAALEGELQGKHHIKDALEHSLLTVRHLNRLIESGSIWPRQFRERCQQMLLRPVAGGRIQADALRFAALTHDLGKPATMSANERGVHFYGHPALGAEAAVRIARRLKMGKREQAAVRILVRSHMRPLLLALAPPTERSLRRLALAAGDQALPLALLAMADLHASAASAAARSIQRRFTARLVACCLARPEGPPLVDGHQIMARYHRGPGREVGRLLRIARRLQVEHGLTAQEEIWRLLDPLAPR